MNIQSDSARPALLLHMWHEHGGWHKGLDRDGAEEEAGSTGSLSDASETILGCGDVVCLKTNIVAHAGRVLRKPVHATQRDVRRSDKLALVMVHFPSTQNYMGVSESDLELLEEAHCPSGLAPQRGDASDGGGTGTPIERALCSDLLWTAAFGLCCATQYAPPA